MPPLLMSLRDRLIAAFIGSPSLDAHRTAISLLIALLMPIHRLGLLGVPLELTDG